MNIPEEISEHICKNCGYSLLGEFKYCPKCGQENIKDKITVRHLIKDFLGIYFHFDSKFYKSISTLLFKPGQLTLDFINGKRARYIPPVKMYIFVSALVFLFFSLSDKKTDDKSNFAKITVKDKKRANSSKIDFNFFPNEVVVYEHDSLKRDSIIKRIKKIGEKAFLDSIYKKTESDFKKKDTISGFQKLMIKQVHKINEGGINEYVHVLMKSITIILFLLLPLFALLLRLFYLRQKWYYVDFLILSVHLHTIIFVIIFVLDVFLLIAGTKIIWLLLHPVIFIYLYFALRKLFAQKKLRTFCKAFLLVSTYTVIIFFLFIITVIFALAIF